MDNSVKEQRWPQLPDPVGKFLKGCGFPDMLLTRFAGVYFLIAGAMVRSAAKDKIDVIGAWKDYVNGSSFGGMVAWILVCFAALTLLYALLPERLRFFDQAMLFTGVLSFSLSVVWRADNYYLAIGVSLVAVVFLSYGMSKLCHESLEKMPDWTCAAIIFSVAAAVTAYIFVTTWDRHRVFSTCTFDFGIFAQMFHSLGTDLSADTTCERDYLLSHFKVHASYIYYLLVPFYKLHPSEDTLFFSQAVLSMGGVIPLYLLAKRHGYRGLHRISVCMIYIFCSGLLAPCYYEFHENCFLPTLLMCLMYAVDQRKYIAVYIFTVLVCIVKEDAPLYVMCIGMFLFFDEKSRARLHGLVMTVLSGIYFVLIMHYLTEYGDGKMMTSSRFGILTIDADAGFAGIVKNVLTDPAYFFSLFVQEQTLLFFLQTMLPVLFLPLMTRKIRRFWLIIPYVVMNLVIGAGYGYAANIGFQYIFGPSALLIYMVLVNLDDMEPKKRSTMAVVAAGVSVITACSLVSVKLSYYDSYKNRPEHYQNMEACLDTVPRDASVLSNIWFLPHIAERRELYSFDKKDLIPDPAAEGAYTGVYDLDKYDFLVLSRADENTDFAMPYIEAAGFTLFNETENYIVIYVSPDYLAAHPDALDAVH
ncbi:MAG: DUF2079 domain-containing protein [Oscillospiraceae bacterium]|nr:DUF2079 domain-containing protein [Oscillospiraceae bacterium]